MIYWSYAGSLPPDLEVNLVADSLPTCCYAGLLRYLMAHGLLNHTFTDAELALPVSCATSH